MENNEELDDDYQKIIKANGNKIKERAKKVIINSQPILTFCDRPFIYPRTINVIEGQQGTNKSRLAETICGSLLAKIDHIDKGFLKKTKFDPSVVAYVETERNYVEQSPKGIQHIMMCAGYQFNEDLPNLLSWPVIDVPRSCRMLEIRTMIRKFHENSPGVHLFVVLDLITDCILDFNNIPSSYEIIDMMLELNNTTETTFLAIIHQNPGNEFKKARGHLGTELVNKSTLSIELGYAKQKDDIQRFYLKPKKTRNTRLYNGCLLVVDEITQMLKLDAQISDEDSDLTPTTHVQLLRDHLFSLYKSELNRQVTTNELRKFVCEIIKRGESTAVKLIKEFIDIGQTILGPDKQLYLLKSIALKGGNSKAYVLELVS